MLSPGGQDRTLCRGRRNPLALKPPYFQVSLVRCLLIDLLTDLVKQGGTPLARCQGKCGLHIPCVGRFEPEGAVDQPPDDTAGTDHLLVLEHQARTLINFSEANAATSTTGWIDTSAVRFHEERMMDLQSAATDLGIQVTLGGSAIEKPSNHGDHLSSAPVFLDQLQMVVH